MNRSPLILIKLLSLLFVLGLMTGCGAGINTNSSEASPKAQLAVRDAYSQMGKPYRLGGASPRQGFDCSGLIYWAYGKNGVKVPRRTTAQLTAGHKVARNAPLPGDIVVFRMGGASLHTGMYAGGNAFIHSPRKGSHVRMESLTSPYWKKKLISIRRVSS